MCWQCDHPGATWQDYLGHLRELLERHCWVVQGVQRERQRPAYAYTVGLPRHQRPELVVTGLPYDRAVDLLNSAAGHVLHAGAPRPGEMLSLRGKPVIEIVRVTEPGVHLMGAAALNGPGFSALQLVYADERGHWPWDAGFRGGRGGQPVLGARRTLLPWRRCTSSVGGRRGGSPSVLSCWPASGHGTCSAWCGG
ncbi:MAG TPA: DUF4262 domain-containing protein [Trebonia sp.]|nr:DUF4262 domain-containing protein [Trebonia sp.]